MSKVLMKGNEALAEAAIQASCKAFFGYPITPQNEVPAYFARRMPEVDGVFLQAESEVAAINMVYGAAGAGVRVMTSSSSPGISLKQEGISYIAGAELPCVIANMVRSGPGLGGILPSQGDYFQSTKGGGHGDYRLVVLAPASVQELSDLVMEAFDIADEYRNPVMIYGDGALGQMMEPVEFRQPKKRDLPEKDWAANGTHGKRERNVINSLEIVGEKLEQHVLKLQAKYERIKERETRFEEYKTDDADIVIVAYGTTSRVARSAVNAAREKGLKVGLLRPITIFPFPSGVLSSLAQKTKAFLAVEMSTGQMVEDVRLAVNGAKPVHFYGRNGGVIPVPAEVLAQVEEIYEKIKGVA